MLKFQTVATASLVLIAMVMSSTAQGQDIDADKLAAAKKAAYEKFIPDHLRDGEKVKPINVDNAVKGHAAYIYGNSGPRPTATITGPTWNRVLTNYNNPYGFGLGNYNYNFNFNRPVHTNLSHHFGQYNPFNRSGYFVVGENYDLPSVFQTPYDSRYRRSQPKLFKVRTHVPRHYVYKNGKYHFVNSHTKTEYKPMITRFIRTRYNGGHHSVTIDYSN